MLRQKPGYSSEDYFREDHKASNLRFIRRIGCGFVGIGLSEHSKRVSIGCIVWFVRDGGKKGQNFIR